MVSIQFGIICVFLIKCVTNERIYLAECPPPDFPKFGGYGPKQDVYSPGDQIHYFCNTSAFIGGNYLRICLDTGDWTGDTPVCDLPVIFDDVEQSSTEEPEHVNSAFNAVDDLKVTCSATQPGSIGIWKAQFPEVQFQVLRVMLFLPKGEASYEVFIVKPDGKEFSCGGNQRHIGRYEWTIHNCMEPHNTNVASLKIVSKSENIPLRLCEVAVHTLTRPTCTDPHVFIDHGHLMLSRKKAQLFCDEGYSKNFDSVLECVSNGVWTRKSLHCSDRDREIETIRSPKPANGETCD